MLYYLLRVRFELTRTNTAELESAPLDHSGIEAMLFAFAFDVVIITSIYSLSLVWGCNLT